MRLTPHWPGQGQTPPAALQDSSCALRPGIEPPRTRARARFPGPFRPVVARRPLGRDPPGAERPEPRQCLPRPAEAGTAPSLPPVAAYSVWLSGLSARGRQGQG